MKGRHQRELCGGKGTLDAHLPGLQHHNAQHMTACAQPLFPVFHNLISTFPNYKQLAGFYTVVCSFPTEWKWYQPDKKLVDLHTDQKSVCVCNSSHFCHNIRYLGYQWQLSKDSWDFLLSQNVECFFRGYDIYTSGSQTLWSQNLYMYLLRLT